MKNLSNGFHMFFSLTFIIDKDVIKIYYHKDIKFLCSDLVDIALEHGQCVGQFKKHHLVVKVTIAVPKGGFLFITFFDPHLMISID